MGHKVPKRPSATNKQHRFATIPAPKIQRSMFNRASTTKTTFDAGYLIPVYRDEVLPGDTINMRATIFARIATLYQPIMDNIFIDIFFFFVPNRLLWQNWERFCGARDNPDSSTDYTIPIMTSPAETGYDAETLHDHLGIPPGIPDLPHSALYHRAYNLIYREWFRDENLIDSPVVDTDNGPDDPDDYVLLKRAKRPDYFTTSLPWPQKGDAVTLGFGDTAPVTLDSQSILPYGDGNGPTFQFSGGGSDIPLRGTSADDDTHYNGQPAANQNAVWYNAHLVVNPDGATGEADLSDATATTINAIRQAFQIQKLLERDARGGTRYTELLRSHFSVTSPDFRLQRPELLATGTMPLYLNAVAQSTLGTGTHQLGSLAAYGIAADSTQGFTKSFTEHGVILGIVCARADLHYQQGLARDFARRTRYDFYWPAFAHLGEQAVLNREIYAQGDSVLDGEDIVDEQVFGYQERYAEYRYKQSEISGQFRSSFTTPLDLWHLAQEYADLPTLGQTFIEETPPMQRVISVTSYPHFLLDAYFDLKHARPMPTYSVPGLVDHF